MAWGKDEMLRKARIATDNYGLSMRVLTEDYWSRFTTTASGFDGHLFELLVGELLRIHFGGGWKPTKISWDGGKDAVNEKYLPSPHQTISRRAWVECKMHRKPVSLRLISNTLVMAVIGDAGHILFFSYSRLLDNTNLHLAQFSATTSISVDVIDDEALETLILEAMGELGAFFPVRPELNDISKIDGDGIDVVHRLSRDIDIDPAILDEDESRSPRRIGVVNRLATLRLQIAILGKSVTGWALRQVRVRCAGET